MAAFKLLSPLELEDLQEIVRSGHRASALVILMRDYGWTAQDAHKLLHSFETPAELSHEHVALEPEIAPEVEPEARRTDLSGQSERFFAEITKKFTYGGVILPNGMIYLTHETFGHEKLLESLGYIDPDGDDSATGYALSLGVIRILSESLADLSLKDHKKYLAFEFDPSRVPEWQDIISSLLSKAPTGFYETMLVLEPVTARGGQRTNLKEMHMLLGDFLARTGPVTASMLLKRGGRQDIWEEGFSAYNPEIKIGHFGPVHDADSRDYITPYPDFSDACEDELGFEARSCVRKFLKEKNITIDSYGLLAKKYFFNLLKRMHYAWNEDFEIKEWLERDSEVAFIAYVFTNVNTQLDFFKWRDIPENIREHAVFLSEWNSSYHDAGWRGNNLILAYGTRPEEAQENLGAVLNALTLGEDPIAKRFRLRALVRPGDNPSAVFPLNEAADNLFDPEALRIGAQVELEHTNDPVIAKSIAKDHLTERSDYYDWLKFVQL